jgi:hypothetical protein
MSKIENNPIDDLRKIYTLKAKRAKEISSNSLLASDKALQSAYDLLDSQILKVDKGLYTPSKLQETIYENKKNFTTQYEVNKLVSIATVRYTRIKEQLLLNTERIVIQTHSNVRHLRETARATLMSDPEVLSLIKTIKHQEIFFDDIYADFLDDYRKLKDNREFKLRAISDYIQQGFFALSAISKFLYNMDMMKGTEFDTGEAVKAKKKKRKKKFSKKDLDK